MEQENSKNMVHTMLKDRYDFLNERGLQLTPKEMEEGWHFCQTWDEWLIHPKDVSEYALCHCSGFEKFAEQVRANNHIVNPKTP